jgi:ABC-type dipeptide/oligopeptide/nickel transport system permease component
LAHLRFIGRRLLRSVPVLLGVTVVVFFLIHLVPGDPARAALGPHATPVGIARLHREWGLDRSLPAQYWLFLQRAVHGNLGASLQYRRSVGAVVWERLPVTLWLIAYSAVFAGLLSLALALWATSRPRAMRDRVVRLLSVIGLGVPSFWLGLVLIEYVAVRAGVLPVAGYGSGVGGHLESLLLPSLTIAAGIVPLVVRSLRAEILRVADSDYVMTARAKGLTRRQIRLRHVLRNALGPAVIVLTVNIGFLIGGTLVVESIFALGGLGDLMLSAISYRDFPVVQGVTLVLAFLVVVVNILGDLAQALLDPRIEAA